MTENGTAWIETHAVLTNTLQVYGRRHVRLASPCRLDELGVRSKTLLNLLPTLSNCLSLRTGHLQGLRLAMLSAAHKLPLVLCNEG